MSWDTDLTGVALDIARTTDSPLRVVAGPGTGKSYALMRRVARLLEVDRVPPDRILAVTFTRNAARMLVDDLRKLGVAGADAVHSSTLHSYCFSILGEGVVLLALGRTPRPIVTFTKSACLQFEAEPLLADVARVGPFGGRREATRRVRAFEAAWARLEHQVPGWPADPVDQAFHRALEGWLRFHRAMLVGEVVPEALRYLQGNGAAPPLTAFDHVLVDEYQDLNRAEQDLLDLLASNGATAVVGDEDQSIYRFRHANPEGIADYGARHVPTHDEVLGECRRCPQTVVRMADSLILRNHPGATGPRLSPKLGNPAGDVTIVQWASLDAEIEGISSAVARLVLDEGYEPGDVMVLTPRRRIGYRIRNRVRALGVAVHSFYNEEALESDDAQAAFNLLTLLAQPTDAVAYRWWLGAGSGTWRSGAYARVRAQCDVSGLRPREVIGAVADGTLTMTGIGELTMRERELRGRLAGLGALALDQLIDDLFPDGDDDFSALREASVVALPTIATPQDLFERLRNQITQPEMPEEGDFVRVMSLHKSKGLTNKVVVIAGAVEGLVPIVDTRLTLAEQARMLEEQRRLFYVALTRCTEVLVISSALHIPLRDARQMGAEVVGNGRTVASRFLGELGASAPRSTPGAGWPRGATR